MKKKNFFENFFFFVEKTGNALPHPATLFALFAFSALLVSAIVSYFELSAINPITKEPVFVFNLLSREGIHHILENMVVNFTDFAPLGIVLVAMLGIGIAEHSGLITAAIRLLVLSSPKKILTFVLVFAGILSNIASDVGYVLLIPLGGIIFISINRHPIIGISAVFAGVSGGFSANLILGTIDPLLAGLSTEAAHILDKTYDVNPTGNYYFMVVSTFIISIVGTLVTEKIVAPRFSEYKVEGKTDENFSKLSKIEKKGLINASLVILFFLSLILICLIPENGFFRNLETNKILTSPIIKGVVSILFIIASISGIVYGVTVKKYKNDKDIVNGMNVSIKSLASYVVLVFFASQFVAYFSDSNLGKIIAINGAEFLKSLNLNAIPLMIIFILLSASLNMLMGSASAKWALMAPIFIPMFMILGYSPELTQVVYRIGDSITNIISPMMSFFALIIAYIQKYDKKAGIGTIIATMLPYSICFFISWSILLIIWITFDLPLGPGAGLEYIIKN